jgi:hypothetical protein
MKGQIETKKPIEICMAVGCSKRAIYINAHSARRHSRRGYCSIHKSFAVCALDEGRFLWHARTDGKCDDLTWKPIVNDE